MQQITKQIDPLTDIKNPFVIPGIKKVEINPKLDKTNSFDNFIEGECNSLVKKAGLAIAGNPGDTIYNPFFIFGLSGTGKTHIAQAIGNSIIEKHPGKVVLYINTDEFSHQYMYAIRGNNHFDFVHFYESIDVLILDDIQRISGSEKIQDILFHLFNHYYDNKKQMILVSDKLPVDLKAIEQRLLSRLKWGLSVEIKEPDYETRLMILKYKMKVYNLELSTESMEYIALQITNTRELEGVLISVMASSVINKQIISCNLIMKFVKKLVKNKNKEISIDFIAKTTCDYFNIHPDDLFLKTRKREIVQVRQIAMHFAKMLTKNSLGKIGNKIGGKDHATVLHACKTVNNLYDTDKKYRDQVDKIEKKLKM